MNYRRRYPQLLAGKSKITGLTLLEVLVAMAVLAWIMVIAQVAIQTAGRSAEISTRRSQELKDIDRVWVLLETDLRNVIAKSHQAQFSEPMPAMLIEQTGEYQLSFIRGGQANPLLLPRTEVLRVAYSLEDEVLKRYSWIDPYRVDEETARPQQLIEGVESFEVRALPRPPAGRSVSEGPWIEQWPSNGQAPDALPLALEMIITLKNRGELRRFITLAPGA